MVKAFQVIGALQNNNHEWILVDSATEAEATKVETTVGVGAPYENLQSVE